MRPAQARRHAAKSRALVAGALLGMLTPSRAAADDPDPKQECVSAHEQTQRARMAGRLIEARGRARSCSAQHCPQLVRLECERMQDELSTTLPTVVLDVRDERGGSIPAAVVTADGARIHDWTAPNAITLDPGTHTLRAVANEGRSTEQRILLVEGETRRVTLVLPRLVSIPPAASPASSAQTTSNRPTSDAQKSAVPMATWTLGGLGLVALGSFTAFGLMGFREQAALEAACAPRCVPGSDSAMRRDYLIADTALLIGVVALVGATYFYLARAK